MVIYLRSQTLPRWRDQSAWGVRKCFSSPKKHKKKYFNETHEVSENGDNDTDEEDANDDDDNNNTDNNEDTESE